MRRGKMNEYAEIIYCFMCHDCWVWNSPLIFSHSIFDGWDQKIKYTGVFDGAHNLGIISISNLLHGSAQNLATSGLWKSRDHRNILEGSNSPHLLSDQLDELLTDLVIILGVYIFVTHHKANWNATFHCIFHSNYSTVSN